MISVAAMSIGPAMSGSGDCGNPMLAGTRSCTDARAAAIAKADAAWLACGGACVIRQVGADADLLDQRGELQKQLLNMRFLPGDGRTDCLTDLAFVRPDGLLTILETPSLAIRETHALSDLYAADFAAEPGLMETVILRGRLSCDGRRFFAPSLDGIDFSVLDLGSAGFGETALEEAQQVVIISASGRYGLGVDGEGAGIYRLMDFQAGKSFATDAVFELDMPFFDIEEKHLLIRKGEPTDAVIIIYDLANGDRIGEVPYPKDGGLLFFFSDGQLVSLSEQ